MIKIRLTYIIFWSLSVAHATGQDSSNGQAPAAPAGNAPISEKPQKREDALNYLYNEQPKDGTAAGKANLVAELLGDKAKAQDALNGVDSLIPPAFEAFLSAKETPLQEVGAYERQFDEAVLLVRNKDSAGAMECLIEMSRYPWDAGMSEQLANRVLALWDMRRNQKDFTALNAKLRAKARDAAYNFDFNSRSVVRKMDERAARERGGRSGNGSKANQDEGNSAFLPAPAPGAAGGVPSTTSAVDAILGKMELTENYISGLEARAKITLNEGQIKEMEKKAREDFIGYIKVLHEGQWHHQTKLATDFYRILFGDGDLPVEAAAQAGSASEVIQRVRKNIETFGYKIEEKRYSSAAQLLREDFLQAPHHPALSSISRSEKLKVSDYLSQLQKMQNLIEARDFGTLDELLQKLENDVVDFDPTKPRALVRAVKRESQMRLGMARLAAQKGELEKAMAEFKSASEAWPDNPDLDAASVTFFESQDVINKSTVEFDRAVADSNYRYIYSKGLEFGGAVKGNSVREEQLKTALEKVKLAETALEKAKLFENNEDVYGAWETVEIAGKQWPEDSKLNQRRADLSIKASDFVRKLSQARKEESKGNKGIALAYYLNALQDYPPSQLASASVKRLSDQVLGRAQTEVNAPEESSAAAK
jgi:hypothetical protein